MRRRSERKKSTDVSSPAPASRRTSRRSRKSPSLSENENNVEESPAHVVPNPHDFDDNVRASSEDRASKPVRRTGTRTSRKRSPITSPTKKRNPRADSAELKVDPIPEEDDKEIPSKVEIEHESANECVTDEASINNDRKFAESKEECSFENETSVQEKECELKSETDNQENITSIVVETEIDKCCQTLSEPNSKSEDLHIDEKNEMNEIGNSIENIVDKEEIDEPVHGTNKEDFENENLADDKCENEYSKFPGTESSRNEADPTESREVELKKVDALEYLSDKKIEASSTVEGENICIKKRKLITRNSSVGYDNSCTLNKAIGSNKNARKHKWVTKSKEPTLAISSDSLKNLIDDVHLVPLSDVKLECSSESDETTSEREEGENSPTPERVIRQHSVEKNEKVLKRPYLETSNNLTTEIINQQMLANITGNPNSQTFTNNTKTTVNRSPSPAKNQKSSILYITNLVRPFTLLQLKGLLARTGKIVEDGFWMDRIKSKCYVQYETADEAIETRHALHGVRWPVSNPKCLHVEFSSIDDMQCAIQSTKEDAPKFGQENNKDSVLTGSGWSRERNEVDEKKTTKPVREWDVGKKESSEREKKGENERSRERDRDKEDRTGRGRDLSTGIRENEKDRRQRLHARDRSHSHSPARKLRKQENDPPLRLLDDLFRKTKATPCIYWLPLTPEQIAEKEAFRLKRIEEHKERVKQRELEREKERGKERDRNRNERERDTRRNRSVDRRRSRSRERRRY